jgi:FkbM family methyltransferase
MMLRVKGPSGDALLSMPDGDHISTIVGASGTYYERDLLDAIRDLGLAGVYVDVGAHCGNHTAFFAKECRSTLVLSVEPNPASFEHLKRTIDASGFSDKAMPHHAAVHSTWRWVRSVEGREGNTGMAMVVEGGPGDVPAMSLDEAVQGLDPVLIKIDAEGSERDILASGRTVLERCRPVVTTECATDEDLAGVAAILEPLGYRRSRRFCRTPTYLWRPT